MTQPYYAHAGITIFNGDCLNVMPTLEAGIINAVITDLPYGTTNCSWDRVIPFAPMWENIKRLITPRAAVVLFGSQPFTSTLIVSNMAMFKYQWVWEKNVGTGFLDAPEKPLRCHEDIAVFYLQQPTYNPQKVRGPKNHSIKTTGHRNHNDAIHRGKYNITASDESGMKYPRSVLQFDIVPPPLRDHPTEKPLNLLRYLILTYTNLGDTILDFTMGSGTSLVAAKQLGRKAIGIELDERYVTIAINRLQQEVLELAV